MKLLPSGQPVQLSETPSESKQATHYAKSVWKGMDDYHYVGRYSEPGPNENAEHQQRIRHLQPVFSGSSITLGLFSKLADTVQ
jgi:hypothetical protein